MKAVGKLNAANTKSFKCLIHQTRTIASIKNCIGSHFSMGETTDWLAVIHQWCEDYCNQPWNEEEFLCFDEDGGVDIDATLDMLVQEKREIREVELFQSMKPMMPDPFERAQVIMKLSKRKQQRDEMTYHKIAVEMKENDVHVGDEYWKAIMEEAFESEKVRKVGEQRIRRYMYWRVCCRKWRIIVCGERCYHNESLMDHVITFTEPNSTRTIPNTPLPLYTRIPPSHNHDNSAAVQRRRRQRQVRCVAGQTETAMDPRSEGNCHAIESRIGHPLNCRVVRLLNYRNRHQQVSDRRNRWRSPANTHLLSRGR